MNLSRCEYRHTRITHKQWAAEGGAVVKETPKAVETAAIRLVVEARKGDLIPTSTRASTTTEMPTKAARRVARRVARRAARKMAVSPGKEPKRIDAGRAGAVAAPGGKCPGEVLTWPLHVRSKNPFAQLVGALPMLGVAEPGAARSDIATDCTISAWRCRQSVTAHLCSVLPCSQSGQQRVRGRGCTRSGQTT